MGCYVITPERRALLNPIRFARGHLEGGLDLGTASCSAVG